MMALNAISILFAILSLYVDSSVQQELKWHKLRAQISKLQCKPMNNYGPERITPCYDFRTKKLVPVTQCKLLRNKHCCMYKCACILKGAGHPKGVIPKSYKLPNSQLKLAKKNANTPRFRKKGCKPKPSTTLATLLTTASKTTEEFEHSTTGTTPTTLKTTRKPKKKPKKPKTKPNPKKPKNRPAPKPTKKPRGGKKPEVTPKPEATPKPCKNPKTTTPSFSFSFFSRLSSVLNGLGFQSKVVRTKPC